MKKIFAVLSLVVFCSIVFTGCDSNSIVGTWKTEEYEYNGFKYTETVTFNEDNTGVITAMQDGNDTFYSKSLTWIPSEENKYLLTIDLDEFEDEDVYDHHNTTIEINNGEFTVFEGMICKYFPKEDIVYVKQ